MEVEAKARQQVLQLLHPTRLELVKQILEKMGIVDLEKGFQGYILGGVSVFLELFEYGGLSAYARGEKLLDVTVYGSVSASRERKSRERLRESIVGEVKRSFHGVGNALPKKYSVKLEFRLSDRRFNVTDIDNLGKFALDSLKTAGVYSDDREVYNLEATKRGSKQESIRITVWEWRDPEQLALTL